MKIYIILAGCIYLWGIYFLGEVLINLIISILRVL